MQAVIVAAGRGTRMGGLSRHTPKCLLSVDRRTLLEHQFHALRLADIGKVTVVAGYLASKVEALLAGKPEGLANRLVVNEDYAATGGAASFLRGAAEMDDDLIYLVCDIIYEAALIATLARSSGVITLGVQRRATTAEDMKVRIAKNRVLEIGKRLDPERAHGEFLGAAFIPGKPSRGYGKALNMSWLLRAGKRRISATPSTT